MCWISRKSITSSTLRRFATTQVLNEGMYSSGQMGPTYYDFSEPSQAEFRRRFGADAAVPWKFTPPTAFAEVLPYLNWGRYQADYIGECYRRFGSPLEATGLPVLTNQNPAHEDPLGMDWWLTRINPERWPVVHYGFTNWIGCVSHSEHAFNRYLLLCKRQAGPNLEENWGFSELYDKRYRYTVVPYFQTVLAIAAGATGFNVYTGVGTAHWDDNLDSHHSRPYPDTAPIGADGALHPKARTLQLLSLYLERYGSEIVTARREAPVSWAIYPPYAALAGWANRPEDWAPLGVKPPRCGAHALDNFQRTMRLASRDFHVVNIEEATALDPAAYPALTLAGGFFMDAATQRKLSTYVRAGGTLVLCHDMPLRDDRMEPCSILRDELAASTGRGQFRFLPDNPFEHGSAPEFLALLDDLGFAAPEAFSGNPGTQTWVLTAENGAQHYFVLATDEQPALHRAGPVTVRLPGRSAAMLRVMDGRLTAALIKGINDCDGTVTAPAAECGGVLVEEAEPCDLLWTDDGLRLTDRPPLEQPVE
jgi:beta-galactosidase